MRKRVIPLLLSFVMVMGTFTSVDVSAAKKKVSLSSKQITINVGQTKTIKVKNTTKKVKWKILSGKNYISLTKKGKAAANIKGKKKGTAKVQAVIEKDKFTCKVTVKKERVKQPEKTSDNAQNTGNSQVPASVPTPIQNLPAPSAEPDNTPGVKPTGTPEEKPTATAEATATAEVKPTGEPGVKPTATAEASPTDEPGVKPTATAGINSTNTPRPSFLPEVKPTSTPGVFPTVSPTSTPGVFPTVSPTSTPGVFPTVSPTATPAVNIPTLVPVPTSTPVVIDEHEKDVTALQNLIKKLKLQGAYVEENIYNSREYVWSDGRLVKINWNSSNIKSNRRTGSKANSDGGGNAGTNG